MMTEKSPRPMITDSGDRRKKHAPAPGLRAGMNRPKLRGPGLHTADITAGVENISRLRTELTVAYVSRDIPMRLRDLRWVMMFTSRMTN